MIFRRNIYQVEKIELITGVPSERLVVPVFQLLIKSMIIKMISSNTFLIVFYFLTTEKAEAHTEVKERFSVLPVNCSDNSVIKKIFHNRSLTINSYLFSGCMITISGFFGCCIPSPK